MGNFRILRASNYGNCFSQTDCQSKAGGKWCPMTNAGSNMSGYCTTPSSTCSDGTGTYCGNNVCDSGENSTNCAADCQKSLECGPSNLIACTGESSCKTALGVWCADGGSLYCTPSNSCSCSTSSKWNCVDPTSCNLAGANWCPTGPNTGSCSVTACTTCGPSTLSTCPDAGTCTGKGGNWCPYGNNAYACSPDVCQLCKNTNKQSCFAKQPCENVGGAWCEKGSYSFCTESASNCGSVTSVCGNNVCESSENYYSCSSDCKAPVDMGVCGDMVCGVSETNITCPADCGWKPPTNACSNQSPWSCPTQGECDVVGGNWCGNFCTKESCPVCDSKSVGNCSNEKACEYALGKWTMTGYGGYCTQSNYENNCSKDKQWDCHTKNDCTTIGDGIWNGTETQGWCSQTSVICSLDTPWACYTTELCNNANAKWCVPPSYQTGGGNYSASTGYCGTYCPYSTNDFCGDKICSGAETAYSCPADCKSLNLCGNKICDASSGESMNNCPADCTFDTAKECGNGSCDYIWGEGLNSCPTDCKLATVCGNQACELGETMTSCPSDCTAGKCGDGTCNYGEVMSCYNDCGIVSELNKPLLPACPSPTAIEEAAGKYKQLNIPYSIQMSKEGCMLIQSVSPAQNEPVQNVSCYPVKDEKSGSTTYQCDKQYSNTCPLLDSEAEYQCLAYGGKPGLEKKGSCAYVTCSLGGAVALGETHNETVSLFEENKYDCPTSQTLLTFADKCESQGLTAKMTRKNACPAVECVSTFNEDQYTCPKPSLDEKRKAEEACTNGKLVERFNSNGCGSFECSAGNEQNPTCQKEIPSEAVKRCAYDNGKMITLNDSASGCITFSYCAKTDTGENIVHIENDLDRTQVERLIVRLDELTNELTRVRENTRALHQFWLSTDKARAEKLDAALQQTDNVLDELLRIRATAEARKTEGMTSNEAGEIATKLVGIKQFLSTSLLLVLNVKQTEEEQICAENDFDCFRDGISSCSPEIRMSATGEGTVSYTAEIKGLIDGACTYRIDRRDSGTGDTQTMSCADPEYSHGRADLESMRENCTGLFDEFDQETTSTETETSTITGSTTAVITASPKWNAGSVYAFSPILPGCRETITPHGKAVRVCPIATQKAPQSASPLTGFMVWASNWGGK